MIHLVTIIASCHLLGTIRRWELVAWGDGLGWTQLDWQPSPQNSAVVPQKPYCEQHTLSGASSIRRVCEFSAFGRCVADRLTAVTAVCLAIATLAAFAATGRRSSRGAETAGVISSLTVRISEPCAEDIFSCVKTRMGISVGMGVVHSMTARCGN
jgi:hypothetical protein